MTEKKVLVPLAPGFEEIEAVTIIDVLRRAGAAVTTAGLVDIAVEGAHGIRVEADTVLSVVDQDWDAIVLPGGLPGAHHLRDCDELMPLLQSNHEAGRLVAAVCAAPIALEAAGVLKGKKATCYPGFEDQLVSAEPQAETVVKDGGVITSRGPGTSLVFALAVVRELLGADKAEALEKGMLVGAG